MRFSVVLLLALATAAPRVAAAAEDTAQEEPDPRSVYEIHPWLDGSVIAVSNMLWLSLYLGVRPDPTCPCDPASVNSFDRHAIGNSSDAADLIGTSLAVGSAILPI